jgi:hypothetical protein
MGAGRYEVVRRVPLAPAYLPIFPGLRRPHNDITDPEWATAQALEAQAVVTVVVSISLDASAAGRRTGWGVVTRIQARAIRGCCKARADLAMSMLPRDGWEALPGGVETASSRAP